MSSARAAVEIDEHRVPSPVEGAFELRSVSVLSSSTGSETPEAESVLVDIDLDVLKAHSLEAAAHVGRIDGHTDVVDVERPKVLAINAVCPGEDTPGAQDTPGLGEQAILSGR